MTIAAVLTAVLCVGGYVLLGEIAVVAVVLAGVGGLTWRVAVASRPRPPRMGRAPRAGAPLSGVRIGHQGDAHVVRDEGRQGE
ncbi:hypothetical protein GCM10018779_60450 [Streptomyces griseocarneus]|nr:hypothetical protein GCM10018779_60450 [Streptomyces griseocarneus]